MNNERTLFQTTILVLILAPSLFANAHYALALTDGTGTMEGDAGLIPGQASDLVFELGSQDAAEITGHLSLLNNATVVGASMTVIPGPGTASPAGEGKDGTVYPDKPWVDVGADGTIDWAFEGAGYGQAGRQTLFGNGESGIELGPGSPKDHLWTITDQQESPIIRLPRNASLDSARLLLEPQLRKDWWNVSWQRRVPFEIKVLGNGLSPARIEQEIPLDGNYRDPALELRLTILDNGNEKPYPFWIVSSSPTKATIGLELPKTGSQVVKKFYLYYDNPSATTSVAVPYKTVPMITLFEGDQVPPANPTSEDDTLYHPMGLYQSSNGTLFIADTGNSRVLMLDSAGNIKGSLGIKGQPGNDSKHFEVPTDVAVDASGHLLVSDAGLDRVQVYRPDGSYLRTLGVTGSAGSDSGHLNQPWGVAVDEDGHVFISDSGNDRVQVFDSITASKAEMTYGTTFTPGRDSTHLSYPMGMSYSGGLYVADTYNARVQKFTALTDKASQKTVGLDRLVVPSDVAVGNGIVYVSDMDPGKVLKFDTEGYFLGEIPGLSWPMGIAVGPTGDLWVLDTGADRVLRFINATFTLGTAQALGAPSDLTLSLDGRPLARTSGPLLAPQVLDGLEGNLSAALGHCRGVKDSYGNLMCAVTLSVEGPLAGPNTTLKINGLDIRYTFSTRMSVALAAGTYVGGDGAECMPVKAGSRNGGRIELEAITLRLDRPPFPLLPELVPSVPEGTDLGRVLELADIFSDEGPMNFTVDVLGGPEGSRAWIDEGALFVDLSSDPNSTQDLQLRITATDEVGQSTSVLRTVSVEPIPHPPVVEDQSFHAFCGRSFSSQILAVDGDKDVLQFYLDDGPSGLELSDEGYISWTPGPHQAGSFGVALTVTDGLFDVDANTSIEVTCIEHPPQVDSDDSVTVLTGEMLKVPLNLTDPEGDALTVSLQNAPDGMRFDASTGTLLWRPSADDVGERLVTISISDGELSVLKSLRIEVRGSGPSVHVLVGPDRTDKGLLFSGESNSPLGKIKRVEYRIDGGPWTLAEGKEQWRATVSTQDLGSGGHTIEFRSFDGEYSEAISSSFSIPAAKGASPQWLFGGLGVLVLVMICVGGVYMLKTDHSFVFCVQKGPDGPMMSVPIGEKTVPAGGSVPVDDEAEAVPEEPPRNIRCIVCLGRIKGAEDFIECPRCGRVYHKACASRILSCVMCGSDLTKEGS